MKTKEIDVWITGISHEQDGLVTGTGIRSYEFNGSYKARLIVEIPDRKIEFTEEQVRSAWEKIFGNIDGVSIRTYTQDKFVKLLGF